MSNFIVTTKALRPAGTSNECFYCKSLVGSEHKSDCVLIRRKVKLRLTVEYLVDVPAYQDKDDIESFYNESTHCASNVLQDLQKLDTERGCLCSVSKFDYLSDEGSTFLQEG